MTRGRILSAILSCAACWSLMCQDRAGARPAHCPDVPAGHWAFDALDCVYEWDIIGGSCCDGFKGERKVTYYEAQIVANRMDEIITKGTGRRVMSPPSYDLFNDVPEDHWAAKSVQRVAALGLIHGFPPTSKPRKADLASRQLVLENLAHSLGYGFHRVFTREKEKWVFWRDDRQEIEMGRVLSGYPGGGFRLDQAATRFELVVMLHRLIHQFYPEMRCPGNE